jgi:hypothetical protein
MAAEEKKYLIGPDEGAHLPVLDITHKVTAESFGGAFTIIEVGLPPGEMIPPHTHAHEDECAFRVAYGGANGECSTRAFCVGHEAMLADQEPLPPGAGDAVYKNRTSPGLSKSCSLSSSRTVKNLIPPPSGSGETSSTLPTLPA